MHVADHFCFPTRFAAAPVLLHPRLRAPSARRRARGRAGRRTSHHKLKSVVVSQCSTSEETSWYSPPHYPSRTGARLFCCSNLLREQLFEGVDDVSRRPSFDDVPVRQAVAEQSGKASRARQTDIVCQPFGFFAEAHGECPMCNESWISRFPLHAMQRALLLRQQGALRSGDGYGRFHSFAFVPPVSGDRLHGNDALQVRLARLTSAGTGRKKRVCATLDAYINTLWQVTENDASMRGDGIAPSNGRLHGMQLYVHNLNGRSPNNTRWLWGSSPCRCKQARCQGTSRTC